MHHADRRILFVGALGGMKCSFLMYEQALMSARRHPLPMSRQPPYLDRKQSSVDYNISERQGAANQVGSAAKG